MSYNLVIAHNLKLKWGDRFLVNKQCPDCMRNVSFTQSQWDLGAELPRDCPWCNKPIKEKEDKTKEYFREEPKTNYHSWLPKGA
jgi:ssDNA-binding Zn-finger/Zn-ribbon topoisomerase 1